MVEAATATFRMAAKRAIDRMGIPLEYRYSAAHGSSAVQLGQGPRLDFSGARAFELLESQVRLGVRAPGTPGHAACIELIRDHLARLGLRPTLQTWSVPLSLVPSGKVGLCNLLVRIPGREPGPCTLLGTHFDTRWIADREPDPSRRDQPILGANDGGSGTAVQLELARALCREPPRHDTILAFMDGEDLVDLDGHPFGLGSSHLVARRGAFSPDQVIALDMVGGEEMHLNLELNSLRATARGREILLKIFAIGRSMGLAPFFRGELRTVWSDHGPWLVAGVPALLLIDIDYPWWHTQADTPEHCSADSLEAAGLVLLSFLRGEDIGRGHGPDPGVGHSSSELP